MDYAIIIAAIIVLLIISDFINVRKRRDELRKRLLSEWGKRPKGTYNDETYNIITYYYNNCDDNVGCIDEITWKDLDMVSFYELINNTSSCIGREYLYYLLRKPCFSNEELSKRNKLINMFNEDEKTRLKIQEVMCGIGRKSRISIYRYLTSIKELSSKKCIIHYIQALLLILSVISIIVGYESGIALTMIMIFVNIITYFIDKSKITPYLDFFAYTIDLSNAIEKMEKINNEVINSYIKKLSKCNKSIKKFKIGAWFIKQSSVTGNMMDIFMDYIKMLFHLDIIMFYTMLTRMKASEDNLYEIYKTVGYIDSMCSIASFRTSLMYWSEPQLCNTKDTKYKVEDVFHPFIEKPVTNSINEDNCVLITGSNASGKSTFIKTLAVNAILAQTIYTSISKLYQASFFNVYTSMALQDNLSGCESYYMVEIKSLKRIIDADRSNAPVLCFVDEVLRGTNTLERIAASSQILASFNENNTMCIAATHDIELTQILESKYNNYHFQEQVVDDDIVFDYLLHDGPATSRNAIKLLKIIGYSENIIDNATRLANCFLEKGIWNKVE